MDAQDLAHLKETRISTGNGYTNLSWPTANIVTMLNVQYYDNHDIPDLPSVYKPAGYSMMIKGLPTASRVNVLGTASMLWNVSHYDDHGQVTRQFSQHYKDGTVSESNFDDLTNTYSFTGQLTQSTRKHYAGNGTSPAVTVVTEQTYDHMERPLDTWTTVDYGTRTLIARQGYNEIGQAISKKLHSEDGATFGQQVNYAYNERGWLKETSSPLFSQQLTYNEGLAPQYNGNISSQVFTRYDLGMPSPSPVTDTYSYSYDKLDRLTQGVMGSGQGRETLTYDRMGNIQSLVRTGTSSTVVDELDYSYSGNRLMGVTDAVVEGTISDPYHLGGSTAYTYDDNGNLKSRVNAGNTGNNMTDVIYNHLNLPSSLTATWATVSYTYDALGRKLQSTNGILGQTREYIDGIEYESGSIELIHHSEGRIVRSGDNYLFEYYLKDHLGNSRSGFGAGTNVTVPNFSADYYPFGMQYWQYIRLGNPKNNYLYNGKELQDGLRLYDYGARLYDPVIGRWGTMDPLAEVHHGYNPYNYVLNNPMSYMDPLGLDTLGINSSEPIEKGDAVRLEDGSVVTNLMADAQVTAPSKPSGTLLSSFYTGGEQVMDPVNGFWNQVLYTMSPRTYNGYEVDNSGRIKPRYIGGTIDVGLASRFKLFGVAANQGLTVYTSVSKGVTQYVGITNNLARRSAAHLASKGINIQPLMKGLTRTDARAVEQALIEIHGLSKNGGTLLNKINSISSTNPTYGSQLQRGYELLKTIGY